MFPISFCYHRAAMLRFALLLAALSLLGCAGTEPLAPVSEPTEEDAALFLSTVHVADPRAYPQMVEGFHDLEAESWRWTGRRFAVLLEPPPPVPMHEPSLEFRFSVPAPIIAAVGAITLTATLNGIELGSETFSTATNDVLFTRKVPARLMDDKPVRVEFQLDKVLGPTAQDERELGVIAFSIGLQ